MLKNKTTVMGFDGFIDRIVCVRRQRSEENSDCRGDSPYFDTLGAFAAYLAQKDGLSCSMELTTTMEKMGGNMPLTGHALGSLGVLTHCIGALGAYPEILPVFREMSSNCILYPIASPGWCVALEFNNGKVMMYDNQQMNTMDFCAVIDTLSLSFVTDVFEKSDLIGLFNWSEVKHSQDIWQGLIAQVLPALSNKKERRILIDLSDCSGKSAGMIQILLHSIRAMNGMIPTVVSVNENEAQLLSGLLGTLSLEGFPSEAVRALKKAVGCSVLILHLTDRSIAVDQQERISRVYHRYIAQPKLQIGGGDNYNAGVCAGLLCGLDIPDCMTVGGAVGSYFVEHGVSPNLNQLVAYLKEHEIIQEAL